jgi:hypothetical protein
MTEISPKLRGVIAGGPAFALAALMSFALVVTAALATAGEPCAVEGAEAWFASIAEGRYEAALDRVVAWSKAEGCACAGPDDACLSIAVEGVAHVVSPSALSDLVARTGNWAKDGRALCDHLDAGDEVGAAAKAACWERHAKTAPNPPEGAAAALWPPLLVEAARSATEGAAPDTDVVEDRGSTGAVIGPRSRSPQKAKDIGREICTMQQKLAQLRERVDNMKRQPPFIRKEQANRLWQAQDDIERIEQAVSRARDQFREFAGRDFDPRLDCGTEP